MKEQFQTKFITLCWLFQMLQQVDVTNYRLIAGGICAPL
jgi:hypothetical protein